ncbi:N-acetylmuramidase domain-containing protein [Marinobacter sp. X15-166B]|uniref:N-acetylmuramidase domain-containing protein n=1 Tax=Marinobacter sp. X15-166B TaxID=1897620 RepID=UPI00085BB7A7|nr:N-acetylmuramidase family protein [Marinobacter sp. X15-166B]OEY67467.1 hypothetical protein BG841_14175 [Marinobacter sp. X15-166B]
MILKNGDVGQPVASLQSLLSAEGFPVEVDGWFGDKTEQAVLRFQKKAGIFVDGIAGPATLAALNPRTPSEIGRKALTEADIRAAARKLGVQMAAIKAVTEVESRAAGFLPSGRPVILFERHVMYRRLQPSERAHNQEHFPQLVNQKPGGYLGGEGEWRRLRRACSIHEDTAIESASWGLFQIMGFHWKALGYESALYFYHQMHRSEGHQMDAFVRFIKSDKALHAALKNRDWQEFARRYNGPAYRRNQYDLKMALAYERHSELRRAA